MEDHALERVPETDRENWLKISWNTAGLITTLVIMFFGAVVCFVAGVRIALLAGSVSFAIAGSLGWLMARVAWATGVSNTLITRQYGLGVRGSALASLIFGCLIVGFLAVENGLLYRGFLFFFQTPDTWPARIGIYGGMTLTWILLTAFGFRVVTRFSSFMVSGVLLVLAWMIFEVMRQSGDSPAALFWFGSQMDAGTLAHMGLRGNWDRFVFSLNILLGPACALALNTADFGRYGRSTADVGIAAGIAIFFQSVLVMFVGGVLMKAAAGTMVHYYMNAGGLSLEQARAQVLQSPYSIAATFMVYGGLAGFLLMALAQTKAQVLNTYSSSLCLTNLVDALFRRRPGRVAFVVLANVIALGLLYGQILEFVELWIKLMGVLLSALAATIIMDYYVTRPRLARTRTPGPESVNWAGVISIIAAVTGAHLLLQRWCPVEVLSSLAIVAVLYPLLRLGPLRPVVTAEQKPERGRETEVVKQ